MAKICIINSLYPPFHRGGAEVVVERIIHGLANLDQQVVLITLGRKKEVVTQRNVTIYRIVPRNIFSFLDIDHRRWWWRLAWHPLDVFNWSGASQVSKILRQEKPEAVLTHNLKGIGYLVPRAIKKLGLLHIHTVHDVQLSRPSGLILYGQEKPFLILDKVYEKICRWLFGSPQVVVSPSGWLLDYYARRGFFAESKKVVLPNPILLQKVDKTVVRETDSNRLELLYVGQLSSAKGVEFLIKALKKLSSTQWRLRIVGDGHRTKIIEQLIAGDLRFELLGRRGAGQLPELYRQADVTVVPSLCYENSPSVIYESLIANTPVIAADIGGIGEIVKDQYNGFTFVPGDEKNLIEVLEYFLSHQQQLAELRRNAFVSVREFSLSNYLKKLLSFLHT